MDLSDDGSPCLIYTRSVHRRNKALAIESPDDHTENIPPASNVAGFPHLSDTKKCNLRKVLEFSLSDGPSSSPGQSMSRRAACVPRQVFSVTHATATQQHLAATLHSNSTGLCASPSAWCGVTPVISPKLQLCSKEMTTTGPPSTCTVAQSPSNDTTRPGECSIPLAGIIPNSMQTEVHVPKSCNYNLSSACAARDEHEQLQVGQPTISSAGQPDADNPTAMLGLAALSRSQGKVMPSLLIGSATSHQQPEIAGAADDIAGGRNIDETEAPPTLLLQGSTDICPAGAGGAAALITSSSNPDSSPVTPNLLMQERLDIHDPYTPWLRTSTKPPWPGSGSMFYGPLSISSSGSGSSCRRGERNNSSHRNSAQISFRGSVVNARVAEGITPPGIAATKAATAGSPDGNASLPVVTPPRQHSHSSANGACSNSSMRSARIAAAADTATDTRNTARQPGDAADSDIDSAEDNCPLTFARRKKHTNLSSTSSQQPLESQLRELTLHYHSSIIVAGTELCGTVGDENNYPITLTGGNYQRTSNNSGKQQQLAAGSNRHGNSNTCSSSSSNHNSSTRQTQQQPNTSSKHPGQTPAAKLQTLCSPQLAASSSSSSSSDHSDSWCSGSEGEQSSDAITPVGAARSAKPTSSGRGGLNSKTGYGSSCRHVCGSGRAGSCGHITPGSSSSLVTRRRRRLQPVLGTSLQEPQRQQDGKQQQQHLGPPAGSKKSMAEGETPAADPYDFEAYLEEAHLSRPHLGTIAKRQQQPAVGRSSISPRAVLSFTPAATAGRAPAAWQEACSTTPWYDGASTNDTASAGASSRLPFASPISPPQLKSHILGSPGSGTSKLFADVGRKGRVAAVSVVGGGQQQLGCLTAPAKAPSSRAFARHRQQLSQQLYDQWNAQVFDGCLPAGLPLVWNPRLTSTAGQVVDDGSQNRFKASLEERVPVRLELSTKVLDCEARLRTTLAHEMCHVGAWAISKEFKQHHGPAFWAWARHFEARVPGVKISTCHNYDIHAPFRWQCSNHSCGKQYHRHKRSIDPNKHACSRCNGTLLYLGKFSKDGRLVSSGVAGLCTPGRTPGTGGNVFSQFVKTHFAQVKRTLPAGTPHKEVMSRLAADYKQQKAAAPSAAPSAQKLLLQQQQQQQQGSPTSEQEQQSLLQEDSSSGLLSFMQRLNLASDN